MQPDSSVIDPSIATCPHFGWSWKKHPDQVPKHVKVAAVLHSNSDNGRITKEDAVERLTSYAGKFNLRLSIDRELATLMGHGLLSQDGGVYTFVPELVGEMIKPFMVQCRG